MFSLVSGKLFQGRITLRAKIFPCITYWEDEVCNGGHGYNADMGLVKRRMLHQRLSYALKSCLRMSVSRPGACLSS